MLARSFVLALCAFGSGSPLFAQNAPLSGRWQVLPVDSGPRANPLPVERVVFHHLLELAPATPWMRVHFADAQLPRGCRVRLTSLRDGDVQTLDAAQLAQWGHGSAFLNGARVSVELLAAPSTAKCALRIEKVWAGDPSLASAAPENLCGGVDGRQPSTHAAVGRLLSSGLNGGCTAFLIDAPQAGSDRCHLSAGHCFGGSQVLQFNVPASSADCALVHPPAASQYAVDTANLIARANGVGDDYAVFKCFRNPGTNLTTYQAQASAIALATALPAPGANLRLTGFGFDGSDQASGASTSCVCAPAQARGARNQVQQTEVGLFASQSGTIARHQVDACAASSGSPLLDESTGRAIGIQTHGGCADPVSGASNAGTAITAPNLAAAIQILCGGTAAPNDECATASVLTSGMNPLLSNVGATLSAGSWSCGTSITADVWHVYRAQCNGTLTIDTCGTGTSFDTVLELYDGSCGALNLLACADDTCGTRTSVSATVVLGTNYYLRVGGAFGATGSYDILVDCNGTTQVPNDECNGALLVTSGLNAGFTNANATTSGPAWPCANGGSDVWFRHVASCTGSLTVETCSTGTDYDSAVEVFAGPCASLSSIVCNDDSCGLSSSVTLNVVQGTTYFLRVGGYNSVTGNFDLRLTCLPASNTNEECVNALVVGAGASGPYTNATATTSLPAWPCANGGNDLWFRYDAVCAGTVVFDTCGAATSFDTSLEVFTGTCGALVSIACNDDSCGLSSTLSIAATAGTAYYLRVGGFSSARGTFGLNVTPPAGNGSFQTIANGCGPSVLTPSGLPNLGATVSFALSGTSGSPLLWLGAPINVPLCAPASCTLGASFEVIVPSATFQVQVPCVPALVGGRVAIQGADIGGPGGCAAGTVAPVPIGLSSTLIATIG